MARLLVVTLCLAAACGKDEALVIDPDDAARPPEKVVVARVGAERFTLADVLTALAQKGDFARERHQAPSGKASFLAAFLDFEVLVREAVARGLHRAPGPTRALKGALARALWERGALPGAERSRLTEPRLRRYYERHRALLREPDRVRFAQILVALRPGKPLGARAEARARAEKIARELGPRPDAGRFAEMARRHSDDAASRARGGDVGIVVRGTEAEGLSEEALAAAFSLGVGETSKPVASPLGFHIVRVTEKIPGPPARFEDVRKQVEARVWQELRRDAMARLLARLRREAKVEVDEAAARALGEEPAAR